MKGYGSNPSRLLSSFATQASYLTSGSLTSPLESQDNKTFLLEIWGTKATVELKLTDSHVTDAEWHLLRDHSLHQPHLSTLHHLPSVTVS